MKDRPTMHLRVPTSKTPWSIAAGHLCVRILSAPDEYGWRDEVATVYHGGIARRIVDAVNAQEAEPLLRSPLVLETEEDEAEPQGGEPAEGED